MRKVFELSASERFRCICSKGLLWRLCKLSFIEISNLGCGLASALLTLAKEGTTWSKPICLHETLEIAVALSKI